MSCSASRLTPHASRLTPHASRLTPHHSIGWPSQAQKVPLSSGVR
ncbi:succinylglutamate desuccinylase [Vreelandella titanicae]|uniref:Succinylglutamate desuccinylase n=1 Tax=Vreelandella titanicae TaxID=664683 RepID=A0A558J346_9GAMM|nr:succinylglutamate desuccinylase [Halomonas titanicae]